MSGLIGEFVKGLRGLKVKELAPYVGGYARANLTPGALYGRAYEHIHIYKKHLDNGSVKPLFDTMGLLFVGAYALAWPQVRGASLLFGNGENGDKKESEKINRNDSFFLWRRFFLSFTPSMHFFALVFLRVVSLLSTISLPLCVGYESHS